ncbi:RHS repeat-associated core domain-containing protein [Alkaliphilus serpentinus]|uniref:Dockerin domain-containing protein n=1 Tax=Alkaliphilus serpentinus TaxID=1482731 RepID=A0A833HME1_9FIRM|nr:RHS repeat-associated core domain-containing protein [Alkaliphilus serpentinus]KAB3527512.1 hypothetical protein F8153_12010 [Alkaliphilus serpentinus]
MNIGLKKALKSLSRYIACSLIIALLVQLFQSGFMVYATNFDVNKSIQSSISDTQIIENSNEAGTESFEFKEKHDEIEEDAFTVVESKTLIASSSNSQSSFVVDSIKKSTNSFPRTITYNKNGYSGELQKDGSSIANVISGNYTPAHSKNVSHSDNTGTTYPSSSYSYSQGGYSGTLSLGSVTNNPTQKPQQESRTFYKTRYNTITNRYDAEGNLVSSSGSSGTDNPTYPINQDGYVGSIPKVDWWVESGPDRTDNPDGSYKIVTTYGADYEGTLTKTVYVTVNNYTGNYSGTVTKPESDTRVWEYTQYYAGTVFTTAIRNQNLTSPPNSVSVGEPVNIITGNYYSIDEDLLIPDIGIDLQIVRSYNSLDERTGIMGKGWHTNYDSTITINASTGNATITYPDGRILVYQPVAGTNNYTSPESIFDVLEKQSDGSYKLELKNKQIYTYNNSGKLTAITDRNNNTITLQYDGNGNLSYVIGASGKRLTFSFENGRIRTITDPALRTIKYTYDSLGNLLEVKGLNGGIKKYTYNSYGLTSITDENNKKFIENHYDQYRRVVLQYDEDRNPTTYSYNTLTMENTYTFNGTTTKYKYNDRLYIERETFYDNTYQEYTYDQWGNRKSIRDRNGNITNYNYDERGNLLSITAPQPLGYVTTFTYDGDDNLKEINTPEGGKVNYDYDSKGNLIKATQKLNDLESVETNYYYDNKGRLIKIVDPENNETILEYDNEKQPEKIIDPELNELQYNYDDLGRMVNIITTYGTTTYRYNNNDDVDKIISPMGDITRMIYDPVGNLTKYIKPNHYNQSTDDGIGYLYSYDSMDRQIRMTTPLGTILALKYDMEGNKIKEINPNYYNPATDDGIGVAYEYDGNSRLIKIVNPSGKKSRIKYDGVGNVIKVIDANNYNQAIDDGPGQQYSYDQLNRLIEVRDTEGRVIERYVYDKDGRVVKSIDAHGYLSGTSDNDRYGTLYSYNLTGWLLEKRVPVKAEGNTMYYNVTKYQYDKVGRLIEEITSPDYASKSEEPEAWHTISLDYYKNGLLKSATGSAGGYVEYSYDSIGNITERKVKINEEKYSITGYEYDGAGRLIRQWRELDQDDLYDGGTGAVLAETFYEYDKNNNITKITRPEGYETIYEYDELDRLVSKREEVWVDSVDVSQTTASISMPKTLVYGGQQYQYRVEIDTDTTIQDVNLNLMYDSRVFEVVEITPQDSNVIISHNDSGRINITVADGSYTGSSTLAIITIRVKEGVKGTYLVTIDKDSTYTDQLGEEHKFLAVIGKSTMVREPDMNNDGMVMLDDFTLTALLKGIELSQPKYHEKYDINNSSIIDIPDLDYIRDYIFNYENQQLESLYPLDLIEKTTHGVYNASSTKMTRITQYEYDKAGNLIKEIDHNQKETIYTYDAYNRLIEVTDVEMATSKIVYDEVGNIIKYVAPENYDSATQNGPGTIYTYDTMNRLIEIKNPEGAVVQRNIYDVAGRITKEIDAKGYQSGQTDATRYGIEYTYDIGSRLKNINTPESKAKGKISLQYTYDAIGNIIKIIDGEGNETQYQRDQRGMITKIIDSQQVETLYQYDNAGNLTSQTDGNQNTTTYYYNSLNLLKTITDPENQTITYRYDKEGRLVRQIDRMDQTIIYQYNRDNNLTAKNILGKDLEERYFYNLDGSLLAATNAWGVDTFTYTPLGQLEKRYRNGQQILSYDYNKNGDITSITDGLDQITRYSYDINGRLKTVSDNNTLLATYNYNPDNTIEEIQYNTGINTQIGYDKDKNIVSMVSKNPSNNIINSFSYTYDNNGNQLSKVENGQATQYTYDSLNQLKTVNDPASGLETYNYDNAGNRISKIQGEIQTTYSYDSRNRLLESILTQEDQTIVTTYSYDKNGNQLTAIEEKYIQGLLENSNTTTNSYDGYNRLISTNLPDGSWQQNQYDGLGLRIATIENGLRYDFTLHNGSIITETNGNGDLVTRSIRGIGLVAQISGKGDKKHYLSNDQEEGAINYYLHNAHGDVVSLVTGSGEVLNSYQYDAFGNLRNYTETVKNRFLYAGEQYDSLTGEYYLRARYYNPQLGRFTQEDVYRGDGLNLYIYVSNNPIMYVDPSGHYAIYFDDSEGFTKPTPPPSVVSDSNVKSMQSQSNTKDYKDSVGEIEKYADGVYYNSAGEIYVEFSGIMAPIENCFKGNDIPSLEEIYLTLHSPFLDGISERHLYVTDDSVLTDSRYPDGLEDLYYQGRKIGPLIDAVLYVSAGLGDYAKNNNITLPEKPQADYSDVYDKAYSSNNSQGASDSPKVEGRGQSKGGHQPENLKEQLAVEEAMSNPSAGRELKGLNTDPRWPASEGWTKQAQNVNGVEVHYQYNPKTGQIDDFKIK